MSLTKVGCRCFELIGGGIAGAWPKRLNDKVTARSPGFLCAGHVLLQPALQTH
jgi:hypothetical protein